MNPDKNGSRRRCALALTGILGVLGLPPTLAAEPPARLQAEMSSISWATRGPVGAAVVVVEGGGSIVALHGEQRFPMQSVYKLPIAMAVLRQVDLGKLRLNQRVTAYVRGLGGRGIVVATTEAAMARGEQVQYRNWATPDAMVGLLRVLQEGKGLSAPSRRLLLGLMTASKTGPGRIKGLLPEGTIVAHKTGSSGTIHGLTRATNDVGLVTLPDGKHLAVVVFVSDTKAGDATRDAVIAKIARAAWDDRASLEGRH